MGDPEERSLYTGAQKVMSVIMTIIEAVAFLIGGTYGKPEDLQLTGQIAIIAQLLAAGLIIILIDEMVQKGWGLGSGISLFIAGGVGLQIFTGLFSGGGFNFKSWNRICIYRMGWKRRFNSSNSSIISPL
jgi:preprotein translocase subunit SecY